MSEENKSIAEIGDERIKKLEALVGKLVEACETFVWAHQTYKITDKAIAERFEGPIEQGKAALAEAKKMKEIPNG